MKHKAGFVNIVGNPNVGKSTLMNALVGERISIITSKAQTTRHRIMGIVNGDGFQIVYSDTPGVLQPKYKLQESMLRFSTSALTDADVLLYVTDVFEEKKANANFLEKVKRSGLSTILIINKIDMTKEDQLEELYNDWKKELPDAEIFPVSARYRFNIDNLLERIKEMLPEGEPFFDKDQLTDKPARFFVTEMIREKILQNYSKEVPYSVEPVVEEFKEEPDIIRISAVINVERDSQKGIIIGHQGKALKKIGTDARKDMEAFFDKKVFLKMFVKVQKDWRNKDFNLKQFGYEG